MENMILYLTFTCLIAASSQVPSNVCPYGAPMENWFCGFGGKSCPSYHFCKIAPDDSYAVCCPSHCATSAPLLNPDGSQVFCGLGGVRCPETYRCNVEPADAWAVCCPV